MRTSILHELFVRHNEIEENRASIWFLHGFGDSGLAYKEVFDTALSNEFNLYVVDLPGFGASPINNDYISIKAQAKLLAKIIAGEFKNNRKINIVAHSIGALIGTLLCAQQHENINYFFNIEGNLTEADGYFSNKPLNFNTPQNFKESFEKEIFKHAIKEESYRRYYSSLKFATPEGMHNWAVTSQEFKNNDKCGFQFKKLNCNKIYIWGDRNTPKETQDFLKTHNIPNKLFEGIGHWHMVENSKNLYNYIGETIKKQITTTVSNERNL